jgi:hypothetical protein
MILPVRPDQPYHHLVPLAAYPTELQPDSEGHASGLPWLEGKIGIAAPQPLNLEIRLLNKAGIPVMSGHGTIQTGKQRFFITELQPIGIEAYAHKGEAERTRIAQLIWSRCTQAVLMVIPIT